MLPTSEIGDVRSIDLDLYLLTPRPSEGPLILRQQPNDDRAQRTHWEGQHNEFHMYAQPPSTLPLAMLTHVPYAPLSDFVHSLNPLLGREDWMSIKMASEESVDGCSMLGRTEDVFLVLRLRLSVVDIPSGTSSMSISFSMSLISHSTLFKIQPSSLSSPKSAPTAASSVSVILYSAPTFDKLLLDGRS